MSLERDPPPRHEVPRGTVLYVALQTVLTLALAIWVLWFRTRHSWLFLCVGAAAIVWSLSSIGGLLDGRRYARHLEIVRVAVLATAALFVAR